MKKAAALSIPVAVMLLCVALIAEAQQPKKIPRIGYLGVNPPSRTPARIEAFRLGLRDLGYVEGKNIFIEYRNGEGKLDRLSALAAELVRLSVDVIVTAGPASNRAAKQATVTLPIVMGFDDDPVGSGYAASLARPGGNITGLSTLAPEISGKQLELLREIVPKLSRLAVLGNASQPGNPQALREINLAADGFRVQIQYLEAPGPKDIEIAFRAASKERADGVLVLASPIGDLPVKDLRAAAPLLKLKLEEIEAEADAKGLERAFRTAKQKQVGAIMTGGGRRFFTERKRIVEFAGKYRLPAIYFQKEFVDEGGLMSYGADFDDLFRRAAVYVDKILKGAKPADLPVQQATKFEFVINLKAAKQIGLTFSPEFLARANQVIK